MAARLRIWLEKISNQFEVIFFGILLLAFVTVIIIIVCAYLFDWQWTGFVPTYVKSVSQSSTGTPVITYTPVPGKSLWDWMTLILADIVTILAAYLTSAYSNRQKEAELQIASDKQRDDALQAYIDKMSELLLEKQLRESQPEAEVRKIARVRTLTILRGLDAFRKVNMLQFLYESDLITKGKPIINLNGAHLRGADLYRVLLNETDLSGVDLRKADLRGADLKGTTLYKADLSGADLSEADLNGVDLRGSGLIGTNMYKTDLSNTDLRGADLSGANLSETILYNANLKQAKLTLMQLDKA